MSSFFGELRLFSQSESDAAPITFKTRKLIFNTEHRAHRQSPRAVKLPIFLALGGAVGAAAWAIQTSAPTVAAPESQPKSASEPKAAPTATPAPTSRPLSPDETAVYERAINLTKNMVGDANAQTLAGKHGLQVMNVTWEDTGRFKGSSVGPNISDMTIQVATRDAKTQNLSVAAMPVIRYPNFDDKTADLSPHEFTVLVGNQANRTLRRVSLANFLAKPTAFMTRPWTWRGPATSLLAPRDSKVLVSAQACFLPIPKSGAATFNPVVFNYQSTKGNPAVLTILATREGTSTTIIDNARDPFESGATWGQRLFHNANGQRASLTGTRESEFLSNNDQTSTTTTPQVARKGALNMVLLVQVPLKYKESARGSVAYDSAASSMAMPAPMVAQRAPSDVENAVIGHGALEGKFTETDNLLVERDPRFPIRVTVQFYKATSNGVVSQADLKEISDQINAIYSKGDAVGSLVTGGETGRVTEYEGIKVQPADWWEGFWKRRESETGWSRAEQMRRLRELLGTDYQRVPVSDLYVRDLLRPKA